MGCRSRQHVTSWHPKAGDVNSTGDRQRQARECSSATLEAKEKSVRPWSIDPRNRGRNRELTLGDRRRTLPGLASGGQLLAFRLALRRGLHTCHHHAALPVIGNKRIVHRVTPVPSHSKQVSKSSSGYDPVITISCPVPRHVLHETQVQCSWLTPDSPIFAAPPCGRTAGLSRLREDPWCSLRCRPEFQRHRGPCD